MGRLSLCVRWVSMLVIVFFIFGLLAVSSEAQDQKEKVKVVIATLLSHPALDLIPVNMKAELVTRGYFEGDNIEYILKNANGDMQILATIAADISVLKPDIVVAITTPVAQAVAKTWKGSLVFSAVTDPVGAGIMPGWKEGNGQVTGVSDMWPYEGQIKLMREILPVAKKVGVLFNPGEAPSKFGMDHIRKLLPESGFKIVEGPCYSPNDVAMVTKTLIDKVDVIYLSSDATVISGSPGAAKVCMDKRKPMFVGDSGTVEQGGLATVSVGYVGVGKETGVLVDRLLKGERDIPTVIASGDEIYVNLKAAKLMRVSIAPDVLKRATKLYTEIK